MTNSSDTTALARAKRFQRAFLRRAGKNVETLRQLAEVLPNVRFNIVDAKERLVAFNRENCANCNFRDEYEAVGRNIAELFPAVLANAYLALYREVRQTGQPVLNRMTFHGADRSTTPRLANVFPVFDGQGAIIGTVCFYRPLSGESDLADWYGAVRKAVRFIDAHVAEKITLAQLAEISRLPPTTFRRAFSKVLDTTPGAYLATIRINRARELLAKTDMTVEAIAAECGFYDPSHFVKTFRKLRHETPTAFRRFISAASDRVT